MRRHFPTGFLGLLLCGCTLGPTFHKPEPPSASAWRDQTSDDNGLVAHTDPDPRWWASFDDAVLTELIEDAQRQNLDVQQAVIRVVESRQSIVTAAAAGLPSLRGAASYQREQLGAKGILESEGVYGQLNKLANEVAPVAGGAGTLAHGVSADSLLAPITAPTNLYTLTLSASWEIDLFGRVRRSVEQARAQSEAQAESANDPLVSVESEVAQAYIDLRGAQALRASQQLNIRSAADSLQLTRNRLAIGLGTQLDVDQARTELLNLEKMLPEYEKQELQAVHRLTLLLGQAPGSLDAKLERPAPLPSLPKAVGAGVPSTLARRRPDIRAAEAQLHAATANVGVAVANFYPDLSLTGSLGTRAVDASYITKWASHYYSAGPSLSLPIFQGGQLTANLRLARAEAVAAALNYRATVLNGLREVEDALVSFRTDHEERERVSNLLSTADDTLTLATDRYAHGLTDYLPVLDSQRTVESSRQQLVQEDMTLANDVITLYRALGGGWQQTAPSAAPPIDLAPPLSPAVLDGVAAN